MKNSKKFSVLGLILNLFGAIFLAFSLKVMSFFKEYGLFVGVGVGDKLFEQNIVSIDPFLFKVGVILLIMGFAFQLIGLYGNK